MTKQKQYNSDKQERETELEPVSFNLSAEIPVSTLLSLVGYENISMDRLITMVEQKQEAGIDQENQEMMILYEAIHTENKISLRGQNFAFMITSIGLIGAMILIGIDRPIGALITFIGSFVPLINSFMGRDKT